MGGRHKKFEKRCYKKQDKCQVILRVFLTVNFTFIFDVKQRDILRCCN